MGIPKVLVEWNVAILELGFSRWVELGRVRRLGLVNTEAKELRLSWSQPRWRKIGISPELASDASASRLPDEEGLGGLRDSRA